RRVSVDLDDGVVSDVDQAGRARSCVGQPLGDGGSAANAFAHEVEFAVLGEQFGKSLSAVFIDGVAVLGDGAQDRQGVAHAVTASLANALAITAARCASSASVSSAAHMA